MDGDGAIGTLDVAHSHGSGDMGRSLAPHRRARRRRAAGRYRSRPLDRGVERRVCGVAEIRVGAPRAARGGHVAKPWTSRGRSAKGLAAAWRKPEPAGRVTAPAGTPGTLRFAGPLQIAGAFYDLPLPRGDPATVSSKATAMSRFRRSTSRAGGRRGAFNSTCISLPSAPITTKSARCDPGDS